MRIEQAIKFLEDNEEAAEDAIEKVETTSSKSIKAYNEREDSIREFKLYTDRIDAAIRVLPEYRALIRLGCEIENRRNRKYPSVYPVLNIVFTYNRYFPEDAPQFTCKLVVRAQSLHVFRGRLDDIKSVIAAFRESVKAVSRLCTSEQLAR